MCRKKRQVLSMRKVREVLRLGLQCGLGQREIARSCGVSHVTVGKYLARAQGANLNYEQIQKMDETRLYDLLRINVKQSTKGLRPQPEWNFIHQELKRPSVTLQLLWEEYKAMHPEGYQLSQFCYLYQCWRDHLKISMRQIHKAGEKMFVDYAGQKVPIRNRHTGEIKKAEIFVAVLGASNYTYAEAQWSQGLENWINGHVHAYEYFDGVPRITVIDNLRSGVSKACRYEPDINPSYHEMAVHYGTVIIPARVRKPQDKSKVEVGVQIVQRWILARLRNETFFSLDELNKAIRHLLAELNARKFKKLEGSRQSQFEKIDHPALLNLPQSRHEFAQWKKATINIDYHVELFGHYYSVPYTLKNKTKVFIRYTNMVVEIFSNNNRVASHLRSDTKGRHSTIKEHMPKSHQKYLEWNPSRIIRWAQSIGEYTGKLVENILSSRSHPEQGYRACLGVLRLSKGYETQRVESACKRAYTIGACSYKSVRSILEKNLDQQELPQPPQSPSINHQNIRGQHYFKTGETYAKESN